MTEQRYRVSGRVQGVGFRWWTRARARELGVRGWVRNLPDGSVLVAAVGSSDAVASLVEALREGPPAARVERVDTEAGPAAAGDRGRQEGGEEIGREFEIR